METENIDSGDHISKLIQSIVDNLDLNNCMEKNENTSIDNGEIPIVCTDCQKTFMSKFYYRKRCKDCQSFYNQKHVSSCPDCGDIYHAFLNDGRVFDKCYKCYLSTVKKCQKCERKAYNGYCLCKICYEESRDKEMVDFRPVVLRKKHIFIESESMSDDDNLYTKSNLVKCQTVSCSNLTKFRFCVCCLDRYKIIVIE